MKPGEAMQPAILGGEPAVTLDQTEANRWPILTREEEQAVLQVVRHGDLSTHPVSAQLEADYAAYFGVRHAVAHANGTTALLAAFFALELRPGDEVLVPAATHWASVVPMLWVGPLPVFCESETERMGLDPDDAARKITPRTRAMVVVHLFGMPSKMTELRALAEKHNLKIIEDASHAHGATWRGQRCGTLGDLAIFSLQTRKLAPAGEGGVLLTDDDTYAERAICLGDVRRILQLESPARRFAATGFGLKTRIAPLSAAVARVQLSRLAERNAERNNNIQYLSQHLKRLGFQTFLPPPHIERVYFEYLLRYDPTRHQIPIETLVESLAAEGCQVTCPRYPLLHQQPLFTEGHFARIARLDGGADIPIPDYRTVALPTTEAFSAELIRLPAFPRAARNLLDQYVLAFEKVLASASEIAALRPRGAAR